MSNNQSPAEVPTGVSPRPRGRSLWWWTGGIVAVVAAAPSVIGWTIGAALVESQVRDALPGVTGVKASGVSLGWISGVSIGQVSLSGATGDSFDGSVELDRGVGSLLVSGVSGSTVLVSGRISTRVLEDGALGISSWSQQSGGASASSGSAGSSGLPDQLNIIVGGLDITLRDATGATVVGEIGAVQATTTLSGGSLQFTAKATTKVGELAGSIEAEGTVGLSGNSAPVRITLSGTNIPVPGAGTALVLGSITGAIESDDIKRAGTIHAKARIEGQSSLAASLDAALAYQLAPSTDGAPLPMPVLSGSLSIKNWPTTSIQPWAPEGLSVASILGPTVDLSLTDVADDSRAIDLILSSQRLRVQGTMPQGGSTMRLEQFSLEAELDATTLAWLTDSELLDSGCSVSLHGSFVELGPVLDESWTIGGLAFEAGGTLQNLTVRAFDAGDGADPTVSRWQSLSLPWVVGRVATTALSQGISVDIAGRCQGASFDVETVVRGLVDGTPSVEQLHAKIGPIDVAALPGVSPFTASRLAQSGLAAVTVEASVESWAATGGSGSVAWTSAGLHGTIPVRMDTRGNLTIGPVTASGSGTGAMIEPWLDSPSSTTIGAIEGLVVDMAPLTLTRGKDDTWSMSATEVEVRARAASVVVDRAPGLSAAVTAQALDLQATIELDQARRSSARLAADLATAGGAIGHVDATANWSVNATGAEWLVDATLQTTAGERLAGLAGAGDWSGAAAGAGSIHAAMTGAAEGWTLKVDASLPMVRAAVTVRDADGSVDITDGSLQAAIRPDALASFVTDDLVPLPAQALQALGSKGAIPLSMSIVSATLVGGAPHDDLDATVVVGPGEIPVSGHKPIVLGATTIRLTSEEISREWLAVLTGTVGDGTAPPHPISLEAAVSLERSADGDIVALRDSSLTAHLDGLLLDVIGDWYWGDSKQSNSIATASAIDLEAHIRRWSLAGPMASRAVNADCTLQPVQLTFAAGGAVTLDKTTVTVSATELGRQVKFSLASGVREGSVAHPIAAGVTAYSLGAPDGSLGLDHARFDAQVGASAIPMHVVDAILRTESSLVPALGSPLNLSVSALATAASEGSPAATTLNLTLDTPAIDILAPHLWLQGGDLSVFADQPAIIRFEAPTEFRDRMLAGLNPILGSVTQAPPIVLRVDSMKMPLEAWRTLDATGSVTTGVVMMERQTQILGLLKLGDDTTEIQGVIGPLDFTIRHGELNYSKFLVGIGKYGSTWQTQLIMSGDIEFSKDPPYAREIAVDYPISSLARDLTSVPLVREVGVQLSNLLQKIPISIGDSASVRVTFSGPLDDQTPLDMKVRPRVDIGETGKGLLDSVGRIFGGK